MNQSIKNKLYQVMGILVIAIVSYFLYYNLSLNLEKQNIATGFSFLSFESGFEISESMIEYFGDDSYMKAIIVGLLNTVKVAFLGNFLAISFGIILGILRVQGSNIVKYTLMPIFEFIKNTPLLLQLYLWYSLLTELSPSVRNAFEFLPNCFISNRGVVFPTISMSGIDYPVLAGLNFTGGYTISPEFGALLFGLVLYTSMFMADIISAGIQAISKGQWEAAQSLGLSKIETLKSVILPQTFRIVIPPITSQILNLTKNSSLAVAIGYPELVSVINTTMNQTGQAIEPIVIMMIIYLIFSLSSSFFMNWFNQKMALYEN